MKKGIGPCVLAFLSIFTALIASAGCVGGRSLRIVGGSAAQEDVTVTLTTASVQRLRHPDRYEFAFSGTIVNNSDEGVMKVIYTFSLRDADGEEFRSFAEIYDGVDTAIPPHGTVDFSVDGVKWGVQNIPASVSVGISSVWTEAELPPGNSPQPGELLYQALGSERLADIRTDPPAELAFHVDRNGYGRTAVFGRGEALDRAVELFCGITIGEETGQWVTDNYNWIRLRWEDGTEVFVSLNLYSLEYSVHSVPHTYDLEHLSEFWSFAAAFLEEG